ncbi:uncharacterized protein BX663DRAFT_527436 [Cokeromyces recurvatus]|uniref:uncharacterized protein n=1 Tax=Cokeromyces recurvatus TaxID=90255 RepID=UPI00221FC663|nr:uncharacterized protein BX663DRAFT_527436 [Cokeromyces recurvatus]KAI7897645.1 hypothetical protein BX663DRAFT_527436 [Cokeromyces recurvatus]
MSTITPHNALYDSMTQLPLNQYHQQTNCSSLNELRQRVLVNLADKEVYSIRRWINSVINLYEQGDYAILHNDLENAYVSYMRGCSILVEIIKRHSTYEQFRQDPVLMNLKRRTNDEIFLILEELALKLEALYMLKPKQQHKNYIQKSDYSHLNNPYIHKQSQYSITNNNNNISTQQQQSIPSLVSSSNLLHNQSSPNQIMSANLKIPNNTVIRLPSWTSNILPFNSTVEPIELARWITAKSNPPSILLIDVRPRNIFKSGCIKHQWIIQVEPIVLQKEAMTIKIQESLLQNPEAEQILFSERARFDLIVYYDQNSKTVETSNIPTNNIRRALEAGQLRRPPMLLAGGFDAWKSTIGERGIYDFSSLKERRHSFSLTDSSNSSRTSSLHSFSNQPDQGYNYHNGKSIPQQYPLSLLTSYYHHLTVPQPLPTAPKKEPYRYPELLSPTTTETALIPSLQQQQTNLCPIPPSYPNPHKRRTYIDNPFNGFTNATSTLYDVPPIKLNNNNNNNNNTINKQRPSSAESMSTTVSLNRPSALKEFHHFSTNNIHSVSSSISQLGGVIHIGTTGLKNLGNTCYMNSIIQCLSGTIPLARYLISGTFRQHVNRGNKSGTGGVLVETFADLLRVLWSESCNFVSPMTFREALIRFAPQFSGTDQQDSQEFLMFLLDGLHEDLNSRNSHHSVIKELSDAEFEKLPDWQASSLSWEKYLARNSSIIVNLFQGQYRSKLTCLSCKQTSTSYNVFMSLSLPIPVKKLRLSSVTLYDCLDYFVKEETLDKEDGWNCPKCRKKRKALKQLTLTRTPDILLIHLKRISPDGLFKNKMDTIVKCPTRSLDLSDYIPTSMTPAPSQDRPSYIYDLYAVSNHYGSLTGGHYTACVRDGYKDKWHYFDDSKFSLCEENKVITKAAYNLFYVRSKIK